MLHDRGTLDLLDPTLLVGHRLIVKWKNDRRSYALIEQIGRGHTAIAWRVEDSLGRSYALKFVPKTEYASHSLDAEARLTSKLDADRFAKIDYYGDLEFDSETPELTSFYGVVVTWVPGRSFRKFLGDPKTLIDGASFCALSRELCQALQELRNCQPRLTHNDLHDENILVYEKLDPLTNLSSFHLSVIDTGQVKSVERWDALIESWRNKYALLETENNSALSDTIHAIKDRIDWFSRTDQEWVVYHLCSLYNKMLEASSLLSPPDKRFARDLPATLVQMIDPDHSRRMDDPTQMYREIERLWRQSISMGPPPMTTPFDLPSAELIRSDKQLMALFSEEYPRIEACRSNSPVYIYGPRGSGKSTILRSLSIKAILACDNPKEELEKIPFLGIYISSSQELRSRFWLMEDDDFAALEGHIVRYFNLLLIEALVDNLDCLNGVANSNSLDDDSGVIGTLTGSIAHECAQAIRKRLGLDLSGMHYAGTSELTALKHDIQRARDDLWLRILDRDEPSKRPDAQLIFDVVRDLEFIWPALINRRIVFLIDDYSNQRIPRALQKRLNQAITFSKQGSPLFKVTSEYDGVDLEGVQEGREVSEVNVGFEYVSLTGPRRYRFLQNVLEKRFRYCDVEIDLLKVLPLSNISPVIPMARAIRDAHIANRRFHYHGLDTIGDLCSGDFAMGIDVVRRVFEHAAADWRRASAIPPQKQDEAIRQYAKQEFEYIRHQSQDGRRKYEIADRLCWLSKECILKNEVKKDKKMEPMVKNHIDISETALRTLEVDYPDSARLLHELTRSGVLFPIQPSRAMEARDATRRFMVRRILLARYAAALGRHRPIRIDDVQRLQFLLTDPASFVLDELGVQTDFDEDKENVADRLPSKNEIHKSDDQQWLF